MLYLGEEVGRALSMSECLILVQTYLELFEVHSVFFQIWSASNSQGGTLYVFLLYYIFLKVCLKFLYTLEGY